MPAAKVAKGAKAKAKADVVEEVLFVPRRGSGCFTLVTANGEATYEGEWTEVEIAPATENAGEGQQPGQGQEGGAAAAEAAAEAAETVSRVQDGQGKLVHSHTGEVAEGEWRLGILERGTYTFANGDEYCGEFREDAVFHGRGCLSLANGNVLDAQWEAGELSGRGTLRVPGDNTEWDLLFRDGKLAHSTGHAIRLKTDPKDLPATLRHVLQA